MAQNGHGTRAAFLRLPRSRGRMVVATLVIIVAPLAWLSYHYRSGRLRDHASPQVTRTIEPRLSSAPWAEFRLGANTGRRDGRVTHARGRQNTNVRHAAAVANLLAGRPRQALRALLAAARAEQSAALWNDLAVARHEVATRYGAPEYFAQALVACDRALELDARSLEALFNRALILERLGLADDGRDAWERYLAADSTSEWAAEARQHLRAAAHDVPFAQRLDRAYDQIALDPVEATNLVRMDVNAARAWAAMEVLARWGVAVQQANKGDAERHAAVARALAAAVQQMNGDAAFKEAVDAIAASGNGPLRLALAEAHVVYRSALQAFQANRPGEAEPNLRRAASLFELGNSPMTLAARYFAANTVLEQGRVNDAQRELEALLGGVPSRFSSYRAQVQWQLGACYVSRGDWGAAVTALQHSADAFEQLGETTNAGGARRLLAFAYERIGDPDRAWTQHMKALQATGRRSTLHLVKAVSSIADAALRRGDWETAVSFLGVEVAVARRIGNDVQLADALYMRAAARTRIGDQSRAMDDVIVAEQVSARTIDPAYREHLRLAALRVRAMLARSPREAVALLTDALRIQHAMSDRINVPPLLLERARALRASGDYTAATADVEQGIALVEEYRQSLPAGEARWGAFHAADELFHEGIALALERNDAAAALSFAESGRARALLESYGWSQTMRRNEVSRGTVIVEYAVLPRHLVIFTVDSAEVRAIQIPIGRDRLAGEIGAVGAAMQSGDKAAAIRALVTVAQRVIHAVEPQLLQANTVVFVPDAVTAAIPFAALPDRNGAFLIERFEVVTAPSAALHVAAAARRARAARPESVLVVSNSSPRGESGRLEYVDREAERVSAAYVRATQLGEAMAQYELLAAQAEATDVLHIAAHAIGDDSGLEPASIAMRDAQGKERHVGVHEVARLKLSPTATVVLAGCDTARGEKRATEGVISLAYGFLTAGAPSVIATLWPVDDRHAAAFFPRIHESLAAGMPPARALREAQLQAVRAGNFPISIWAALQCIGS